jgi:DnaJ-class molecular chaperone
VFGKRFTELIVKCEVTLEEYFYGCKKEIFFERIVLKGDERSEKFELTKKEIEIKPGMGDWTELVFKNEGHERYGHEIVLIF